MSQPRAVDAGWARLAEYDQAYGSWRQRWLSTPQQEIGAGDDSTCVTAAGAADMKPARRTVEKIGEGDHSTSVTATGAANTMPARRTTETAPILDESPTTDTVAWPAAEKSPAQMRCQMVQTEDSTLAESTRVQAAFMIQRAATRQHASRQQREGTNSCPPVLGPTDAGASSSEALANSPARRPAKPFGTLVSEQCEEQQKQWSLLQDERRALQDKQEQLATSAHQKLLAEQERSINEQRSQHQLLLNEQHQVR